MHSVSRRDLNKRELTIHSFHLLPRVLDALKTAASVLQCAYRATLKGILSEINIFSELSVQPGHVHSWFCPGVFQSLFVSHDCMHSFEQTVPDRRRTSTSKEMGADRPATSLLTFSFKSDQNNNGRYFWLCRLISEAREESVHLVYTPFMGVLLLYSSM